VLTASPIHQTFFPNHEPCCRLRWVGWLFGLRGRHHNFFAAKSVGRRANGVWDITAEADIALIQLWVRILDLKYKAFKTSNYSQRFNDRRLFKLYFVSIAPNCSNTCPSKFRHLQNIHQRDDAISSHAKWFQQTLQRLSHAELFRSSSLSLHSGKIMFSAYTEMVRFFFRCFPAQYID
jgi:hypothetical protein